MWTTKDIMTFYQVSKRTVYNWIEKGLPKSKLGRSVRYNPEEVKTWVETNIKV